MRFLALITRCFIIFLIPSALLQAGTRPNILWLTSEDNNVSWVGCYGNPEANTPNIDQLAADGFQYMRCFANAPVCSPQRSTWITGVHALSMGTQPMRSRNPIPHERIQYYPDYLKAAGYFVSNHTKTDYNIGGREDDECWDSKDEYAWRLRDPDQPFFCIINNTKSHESGAHGSVENTLTDPSVVQLRAYHPDLPVIRKNYAKYMDRVTLMDAFVGEALKELEKDGLLEDTIVIYNSDHGGVMGRSKRFLFDSGLHCPLILRIPEKYRHFWPADQPGMQVNDLVSFIDMIPTWLELAGVEIPAHMQGRAFLGENQQPREYHFAYRGRMDERIDNQRAVHDGRYLYVKNYMPWAPWGQHLHYLWRQAAVPAWEAHHRAGQTNAVTGRFFRSKPVEELYDTASDPDCVVNLARDPSQADRLKLFRQVLREWQLDIHDAGLLPEQMRRLRAEANGLTHYDLVRDSKLYNLPGYLDAADLALAADPANLPRLRSLLGDPDPGMRFWGTIGLLMLETQAYPAFEGLLPLLQDPDHEVRAYAAWVLIRNGYEDKGITALQGLIQNRSDATLTVLNIVDFLGSEAFPLTKAVADIDSEKLVQANYVGRKKEYLLKKNLEVN